MSPGLKILQIQVTYYRAITFVGWLRRVSGDEYHLLPGARIITRSRGSCSWSGVQDLASDGPGDDYKLSTPAKHPEELHRLGNIKRCVPADEKVWAKHVPKPKNWEATMSAPG